TMPAGKEILVEHAEDGFKVTVGRMIKLKGKTLDELTYTNKYLPSRNVTLVGTKGGTPRPTVTPTGSPPRASRTPARRPTLHARHGRTPRGGPTAPPRPATTATPGPKPTEARLPTGQVKVPALVGMPEAQARALV